MFVANAHYVIGDLRAWGWVTLIIAILQLAAGGGVLAGNQLARWFAVAILGISALEMMFFIPAYPFWALVIIAIDVIALYALVRQILLAAAAIDRGDSAAPAIVAGVLGVARRDGFFNTVVTTAPQLTSYLLEQTRHVRPDPFTERLIAAALQIRAAQPDAHRSGRGLVDPLTAGELRVLKLLPISTYPQIAAALYISRNTVKTHMRSIYQKLGVTSRSQAIERAVDLRLL